MKKLATIVLATAALALVANAAFAANAVRISQVYGGGGAASGSPTYNVDYVELFNNSGAAVNIGGWTIEYGSATGAWGSSPANIFTFPANTLIQPCKYVLVSLGVPSAAGANLSPAADFSGTIAASATTGKVALFKAINSNLACGSEIAGTLVDKMAYGPTATCAEGTAVGLLSNQQAAVRNGGGTTDTDNNSTDFAIVLNAQPRNSGSPANTGCLATPTSTSTWGALKSIYR